MFVALMFFAVSMLLMVPIETSAACCTSFHSFHRHFGYLQLRNYF